MLFFGVGEGSAVALFYLLFCHALYFKTFLFKPFPPCILKLSFFFVNNGPKKGHSATALLYRSKHMTNPVPKYGSKYTSRHFSALRWESFIVNCSTICPAHNTHMSLYVFPVFTM